LTRIRLIASVAGVAVGLLATGCNTQGGAGNADATSGTIQIDGSSTVYPITEAIAEEFKADTPDVSVRVGQSGTGGGFEKFCNGEIQISDASRPIEDDEKTACAAKGVEWLELKVAIDGLSVVVNKDNDFVECLTTDDLKKIWEPDSNVQTWKDVKNEWPADDIKLYGPGSDSGTFDYFTKEINGEEGASRTDYTQSEDDNVLVQGVKGDKNALGYFGFSYLEANLDSIHAVGIDSGNGCVQPTKDSIPGGAYKPLSRPLYIYASTQSLAEEHVRAFVEFYLDKVNDVLVDVKYIPLPDSDLQASKTALDDAV
jgi:phosphate transport system substrate-binding protein